jgi:hypothetical protein
LDVLGELSDAVEGCDERDWDPTTRVHLNDRINQ